LKPYRITQHIGQGPEQGELDFGAFPKNPFKPEGGAWRVFEHIKRFRRVDTWTIKYKLHCLPERLRVDVKPYLQEYGYQQKPAVKISDGNYLYEFERLA
jgi:hypothetical protein